MNTVRLERKMAKKGLTKEIIVNSIAFCLRSSGGKRIY